MIRLLIFAIPLIFIALFIREYLKQKRIAEENWQNQWEEKKKNFRNEQELKAREREIQKLKNKLEEKENEPSRQDPTRFSNN